MSVHVATLSDFSTREPFASVGLTCTCGRNVVGFEGLLSCKCGALYTVSVMVIRRAANSHGGPDA